MQKSLKNTNIQLRKKKVIRYINECDVFSCYSQHQRIGDEAKYFFSLHFPLHSGSLTNTLSSEKKKKYGEVLQRDIQSEQRRREKTKLPFNKMNPLSGGRFLIYRFLVFCLRKFSHRHCHCTFFSQFSLIRINCPSTNDRLYFFCLP